MKAFTKCGWLCIACLCINIGATILYAQPKSTVAVQKKMLGLLESEITSFCASPASPPRPSLLQLKHAALTLAPTLSCVKWADLIDQEEEWFRTQSPESKSQYSKLLLALDENLDALRIAAPTKKMDTFNALLLSVSQVRAAYAKSATATAYLDSSCELMLDGYPANELKMMGETELIFRSRQFGESSSFTLPMQIWLARMEFELGVPSRTESLMAGVIKNIDLGDFFLLDEVAAGEEAIARRALSSHDIDTIDSCIFRLAQLANKKTSIPQISEKLASIHGWRAVAKCDIAYLIEQGEAIDPRRVSSKNGCERLCNYAIGLCECGESKEAIRILDVAYRQLSASNSLQRFATGFTLAKVLSYEEQWTRSAEMLSELRNQLEDDASETAMCTHIDILSLWVRANHLPKEVTIEDLKDLRKQCIVGSSRDNVSLRNLDLIEATMHLRDGTISDARDCIDRVKQADLRGGREKTNFASLQRAKVEARIARAEGSESLLRSCMDEIAIIQSAQRDRCRKFIGK